ncbi:MAG: RecQ family ATP-dependent DNA helicase [Verrucomicrobiota bacterium]
MLQILHERFGHKGFRDGQEPVIRALLAGRPALAVFPTGGGKSLCYQLPALLLDGLTLVISPLIALMKDQVDALSAKGIAAARLDSTLDVDELAHVYAQLEAGSLKLLYVAPERLANENFRQRLKNLPLQLVAIDEAHCISEWGHNFRPEYLKLARLCRTLKIPRVLALTATATPRVAREIRRHFRIAAADHVQLSFHRPNLELRITPCAAAERKAILLDRIAALEGSVVVYVTRQETAEEVATWLARHGHSARAYHAGLPDDFRADAQRAFMAGDTRIMVATIAFGMGIDKADIRGVIHYNLPKSLENHTQEIGRAGRDGGPAVCELLACGDDLTVLENFIYSDTPTPGALGNLLDRVLRRGGKFDLSTYDLSVTCDIRPTVVATVLTYLEIDRLIEATGSFYAGYRAKLLRTPGQILAGRKPAERRFLQQLLESGKPGRGWLAFEPAALAADLGVARQKVVTALGELQAAGDLVLEHSGLRQGYVMKNAPGDLRDLTENMFALFERRELADLERLRQVLALAGHRGCLTAYLTRHFGETLIHPCGHCDRCRGVPAQTVTRPPARRPSDAQWQAARAVADENHAALATPRQLARFLCGLTSPASTRARLTRHPAFGLLSDLPFADVRVMAEAF